MDAAFKNGDVSVVPLAATSSVAVNLFFGQSLSVFVPIIHVTVRNRGVVSLELFVFDFMCEP